jgi:hypothetical protein
MGHSCVINQRIKREKERKKEIDRPQGFLRMIGTHTIHVARIIKVPTTRTYTSKGVTGRLLCAA